VHRGTRIAVFFGASCQRVRAHVPITAGELGCRTLTLVRGQDIPRQSCYWARPISCRVLAVRRWRGAGGLVATGMTRVSTYWMPMCARGARERRAGATWVIRHAGPWASTAIELRGCAGAEGWSESYSIVTPRRSAARRSFRRKRVRAEQGPSRTHVPTVQSGYEQL